MKALITAAEFVDKQMVKLNHEHDYYQIVYVTRGSADFAVGDKQYHATKGQIAIFSRVEQHSLIASSQDYQRYIVQIRAFSAAEVAYNYKPYSLLFNRPEGFLNVLNLSEGHNEIQNIFDRILKEANSDQELKEDVLNLLLQELLIRIYRLKPNAFSSHEEGRAAVVNRIREKFEREYYGQFTLAELANQHGLSTSYLSHVFKEICGVSIMRYLQNCRINAAKRYLAETTLTINQIVERCGFMDSSNFSRIFRREVGCSPSDYRKQMADENGTVR